jgi:hypothetical protein
MSLSNFAETEIANWIGANGAPSAVTNVYLKLHIGDPGEDCTGNPAAHTTREEFTTAVTATDTVSNEADTEFTPMAADEEISHVSVWDDLAAGNPLIYGALADPQVVNAGGLFRIPAGDLDLTLA